MTINIDKRDIGTSIKVYITKQDLEQEAMRQISNDHSKDFRKQKTYKLSNFSDAKSMLLKKIIETLYNQYSYFYEIIKSNDLFAKDAIKSKLYNSFSSQIDAYSKNIFDEIYDIAHGFVFDIQADNEVHSIKDKYQLSKEDLIVTAIGTYGYGKTTLIKKILGFDDFIFPLVDRGRTTINNCYLRGMLIRNGKIEDKDSEEYPFKNQITLYDPFEFFNSILLIQLSKAYIKFDKLDKMEHDEKESEILKEFVSTDAGNLDELFGDIEEFIEVKPPNSFYQKVLDTIDEIKSTMKEDESLLETISNLGIKNDFKEFYSTLIQLVLKDLKETIYENNTITFNLNINDITEIDKYYFKFISNNADYRGELVRQLVKEIYLEVDLNTEEIISTPMVSKNNNIRSILFTDTMGAGHTTNKTSSKGSENIDISKNFSLLNESDIILLLDDATQTMNSSTLQQIKLLDSYGLREKTILVYSKYNQFLKGDFKSDNEREQYLINKLNEKLYEIFPLTPESKSEKAKLIYEMFSDNKKQIVFLKGLIPYQRGNGSVKNTSPSRKKRQNNSNLSQPENLDDDLKADILNKDIEESTNCLIELFDKICIVHQTIKELKLKRCTIFSNIDDSSLALSFSHFFDMFSKNNNKNEYNEYITTPPEWNTSEALCYKLYCGETGFYGLSRILFPLEDAKSEFMLIFNEFIENILILRIEGDDSLSEDFLKNKIKNVFTNQIDKLFYTYFIKLNKADWKILYNQGGTGAKARRANGIYSLINSTFSQNLSIKNSSFELFTQATNEIIEYYKS